MGMNLLYSQHSVGSYYTGSCTVGGLSLQNTLSVSVVFKTLDELQIQTKRSAHVSLEQALVAVA